jgi:uncharacterized membrane protein YraQ (UPF0718 family)
MLSTIIGVFLIAHGVVHAILATAPIPKDPDSKPGAFFAVTKRSWLLRGLGLPDDVTKWMGISLVVAATLTFVLSGSGVLGVPVLNGIWQTLVVIAAGISMMLLILFWHSWLFVGFVINALILVSLVWLDWTITTIAG